MKTLYKAGYKYKIKIKEITNNETIKVSNLLKQYENEFIDWIKSLPLKHGTGDGHDYFCPNDCYYNDIGVFFVIDSLNS